MLKAIIVWFIAFAGSALIARGEAWRWAFGLTMPFPSYDNEAIYQQIKGRVLSRTWLLSALAGSTLIAFAMLLPVDIVAVVPMLAGVILIVGVSSVQGYRLVHRALSELGLPWPPEVR